jgi:single-stranded-DNA-specific exonuclease
MLTELRARLLRIAGESLDGLKLERCIGIDAIMPLSRLNGEVIQWLNKMQPFGEGNPAPVFLSHDVQVLRSGTVGGDGRHLRLTLRDRGATWDAIAFDDNGLQPQSNYIDVVYSLSASSRQDRRVLSLRILDMADAG